MVTQVKKEVEILWWEKQIGEKVLYRAEAYYKDTNTIAWHSIGYDLDEMLLYLQKNLRSDGLTIVSTNKGKTDAPDN